MDIIFERYEIATSRIREIINEDTVSEPFKSFFCKASEFICKAWYFPLHMRVSFSPLATVTPIKYINNNADMPQVKYTNCVNTLNLWAAFIDPVTLGDFK